MAKYGKDYFEKNYGRVFENKYTDWLGYKSLAGFTSDGGKQKGVVLEVGCGLGTLTFRLARYWKKVVGIDVSYFALDQARKIYNCENMQFIAAEGSNLPFAKETFDCVVISNVIEHLSGRETSLILKEIQRVLKKAGFLVTEVPVVLGKSLIDVGLAYIKPKNRQLMRYTNKAIKKAKQKNPDLDTCNLPAIGDPTHKRLFSTKRFVNELIDNGFYPFQFARRRLFKIIFFGSSRLFNNYVKFYLSAPRALTKMLLIDIGSRLKAYKRD